MCSWCRVGLTGARHTDKDYVVVSYRVAARCSQLRPADRILFSVQHNNYMSLLLTAGAQHNSYMSPLSYMSASDRDGTDPWLNRIRVVTEF